MESLVLQPTAAAQWQSLVKEAESSSHCQLEEDLESYLVFLLMRFTGEQNIAARVLTLDYLHAMHEVGQVQRGQLRDVGDLCLLHAGLFPLRAQRRRVSISYFVGLGRSAYRHLAGHMPNSSADTYMHLAQDFVQLMDILQTMRTLHGQPSLLEPLVAHELWSDTGSHHAHQVACSTSQDPAKAWLIKGSIKPSRPH